MKQSTLYRLYAHIIPVKGYLRSVLCNVNNGEYYFVPNELIEYIDPIHQTLLPETPLEYEQYLQENNWIFEIPKNMVDNFPPIPLAFKSPGHLQQITVELTKNCNAIIRFIKYCVALGARHLYLYSKEEISEDYLHSFLSKIKHDGILSVQVIIPFQQKFSAKEVLQNHLNIRYILQYNAPKTQSSQLVNSIEGFGLYIMNEKNALLSSESGVLPDYFSVNISHIAEAQNHHTYFNKRLSLDANQNIRYSLSHPTELKHISDFNNQDEFANWLQKDVSLNLWNITKDQSDICKNCEFRYICTDNREPKPRTEKGWLAYYHESPCNYNPYIAKWNFEKEFVSLAECGVVSNENQFSINEAIIEKKNEQIWN